MPLNQLRRLHPFLAKLSLEAVGTILQCGSIIVLERDQVLYKEKEEDLKFYMIIFGCLELLTTQKKQRAVIAKKQSSSKVAVALMCRAVMAQLHAARPAGQISA